MRATFGTILAMVGALTAGGSIVAPLYLPASAAVWGSVAVLAGGIILFWAGTRLRRDPVEACVYTLLYLSVLPLALSPDLFDAGAESFGETAWMIILAALALGGHLIGWRVLEARKRRKGQALPQ